MHPGSYTFSFVVTSDREQMMKIERGAYPSSLQKRKLIQFIAKHPEMIACKVTQTFNYKDAQRLWQTISNECNAIPGAKKTWKQWKKMFQDLRTKSKKKQKELNGALPPSAKILTKEELAVVGFKNVQPDNEDSVDLAPIEQQDIAMDDNSDNYVAETDMDYNDPQESIEEPKSPPETKVFDTKRIQRKMVPVKRKTYSTNHLNNCLMNCDVLSSQEQHKIRIKEDYLNFKKEYLKQKLKLMREQTEALKSIAKEFTK